MKPSESTCHDTHVNTLSSRAGEHQQAVLIDSLQIYQQAVLNDSLQTHQHSIDSSGHQRSAWQ